MRTGHGSQGMRSEGAGFGSPGNVAEARVAFSLKRGKAQTGISFPDALS